MADNFWQTFRRAQLSEEHNYVRLRRAIGVSKLHNQIHIPPFNIPTPVWLGASYITIEFSGLITNRWSLKRPIIKPSSNPNFCLAIRWIDNAFFPINVVRYKLWENVGEDLDYPLYTGQSIPSSFVLEVWSTITGDFTSLQDDYYIPTSILTPANLCCGEAIPTYELTEKCELFTPLPSPVPIVFNDCYNDLPPFTFLDGDVLVNHLDYYVRNANGEVITWNSI